MPGASLPPVKPFDAALVKMRRICLSLPDTKETPTWGQPHFRVGEKIFAGCGLEKGAVTVGFKLQMDHADAMVRRPGFSRAPYVGHKGWVSVDPEIVTDWNELRALIHESYRLIAPKRTLAKWESESTAPASSPRSRRPEPARKGSRPKRRP
jgi:predicted DNA-binding protein (MmcQ/YjbR family)